MKIVGLALCVLTMLGITAFFLLLPDLRRHRTAQEDRKMDRRDRICCLVITLVYAAAAFFRIGNTDAPQRFAEFNSGEEAVLLLEEPAHIDRMLFYTGINTGRYSVSFSSDGLSYTEGFVLEQDYAAILKWMEPELPEHMPESVRAIRIKVEGNDPWLGEIAAFSGQGPVALRSESEKGQFLTDEQLLIPVEPDDRNSSYFDEVYHVRTAVEHIRGMWPYEISHPPLGKLILSLGIRLFGLTPFGWRFSGTFFGALMLPVLYVLLKELTGDTLSSACGTALLASDFMHFVQTRIATIDTYAVFFILLMYLFMLRYVHRGRKGDLALSGLFFGFGAACKWTCIYAGAGLAVIWFVYRLNLLLDRKVPMAKRWKSFFLNCLWCLLFFVAIPACIYCLSYFPYGIAKGMSFPEMFFRKEYYSEIVLENQRFMFTYHSGVTASHPYSSLWYQWMLDIRPILYYLKYFPDGGYASIAAFLNPLLCWGGLAAVLMLLLPALRDRNGDAAFVIAGYLAQLVPWMFVDRVVFEYHYFPSSVFLIMALAILFSHMRHRKYGREAVIAFTVYSALLFCLFYPVLSALPVDRSAFSALLGWLPTWPF